MKLSLKYRRFEKILALITFLLAVFAALLGEPYTVSEQREEIFTPREMNGMKIEYLRTYQVAEWIMEKREDFIIIDVRTLIEFNTYHIPSAQHITYLNNTSEMISPDQIIILYAKNTESTIESWLKLKQRGFENIYLMQGGINSWAKDILFPDLSFAYGLDKAMIEKIKKTSLYFGGKPRLGEFQSGKSGKRYHREGC